MPNSDSQAKSAAREPITQALACIPSGLFVLTAAHEDRRLGMLTGLVQQVCFEPAMVSVAIAKGRAIMPLISESRQFALCQLAEDDRVILRKFRAAADSNDDPFLGFELTPSRLPNLPVLAGTMAYLECELTCHMDVEGDHDLFVGTVRGGACHGSGSPHVYFRQDGASY